jgi:hypothetical protein
LNFELQTKVFAMHYIPVLLWTAAECLFDSLSYVLNARFHDLNLTVFGVRDDSKDNLAIKISFISMT